MMRRIFLGVSKRVCYVLMLLLCLAPPPLLLSTSTFRRYTQSDLKVIAVTS